MARGDLDLGLLHRVMVRLGELRDKPPMNPPSEGDLMNLVTEGALPGMSALNHLQRHTEYLVGIGMLKIVPGAPLYRVLKLTDKGQTYVQPELAEFAEKSMLPAVVKNVEERIAVLTYPEPEKAGMVHELRKAVAAKAPELIAKVLVEIGSRIADG